jgi:hypothetical protein
MNAYKNAFNLYGGMHGPSRKGCIMKAYKNAFRVAYPKLPQVVQKGVKKGREASIYKPLSPRPQPRNQRPGIPTRRYDIVVI